MNCPKCAVPLNAIKACDTCGGSLAGLSLLNLACPAGYVQSCLDKVKRDGATGRRECAQCARPMTTFEIPDCAPPVELDFCLDCRLIWFDANELRRLPKKSREQAEIERSLDSARRMHRQLESELESAQKQLNYTSALLALSWISR